MSNPYIELSKIAKSFSLSSSVYSDAISQLTRSAASFSAVNAALKKQIEVDRRLFGSTSAILDQVRQIGSISPNIQALTIANTNLTRMLESVSMKNSAFSRIFQDQQRLHDTIKGMALNDSLKLAFARIDTTRMFSASLVAQTKLAAFDRLSLGTLAGIDTALSKALTINLGNLTRSYQSLLDAASTRESLLKHVPFITTYSPVEYYREIEVLQRITVEDDEAENEDEIVISEALSESVPSVDALLADFNDQLCRLLQGARDSLASNNPDRARHVTTSVRELFTQVLHALAPDDEIRAWSTNEQHFYNNRPTRHARLLYISRHINCDPLTRFVEDDVRAALSFVDALNAGTHVVESRLTESQLGSIISRMESLLVFLLQLRNTD